MDSVERLFQPTTLQAIGFVAMLLIIFGPSIVKNWLPVLKKMNRNGHDREDMVWSGNERRSSIGITEDTYKLIKSSTEAIVDFSHEVKNLSENIADIAREFNMHARKEMDQQEEILEGIHAIKKKLSGG